MNHLRKVIIVLFFGLTSCINDIEIPNENFKQVLLNENCAKFFDYPDGNVDINNNGVIELFEVENVKALWLVNKNLNSITGIEHFKNIEYLDCSNNLIQEFDLKNNQNLKFLSCSKNLLNEIILTENKKLEALFCSNNNLSSLNLSLNPHLEGLVCSSNQIENLILGGMEKMLYILCNSNKIKSIDVTVAEHLNTLICDNNELEQLLYNDNLHSLSCSNNTNIDCEDFGQGTQISI